MNDSVALQVLAMPARLGRPTRIQAIGPRHGLRILRDFRHSGSQSGFGRRPQAKMLELG
jgi:hypothetical protein